jgi:hypothetical protein
MARATPGLFVHRGHDCYQLSTVQRWTKWKREKSKAHQQPTNIQKQQPTNKQPKKTPKKAPKRPSNINTVRTVKAKSKKGFITQYL